MEGDAKDKLIREIIAQVSEEGIDGIDEDTLMEKVIEKSGDLSAEDEAAVRKGLDKFLTDTIMSQLAQTIKSGEAVGMQVPTLSRKLEKKVIKNQNINNTTIYNSTTINGGGSPTVGNSAGSPAGGNPTGGSPTGGGSPNGD